MQELLRVVKERGHKNHTLTSKEQRERIRGMKDKSGSKSADTAEKMLFVQHVSQENAEQLDDSGKV